MPHASETIFLIPAPEPVPGFYEHLAQAIADLKQRLQTRYERHFPGQAALIGCILEEAESVAWCTPFPQLFLPDLVEARLAEVACAA